MVIGVATDDRGCCAVATPDKAVKQTVVSRQGMSRLSIAARDSVTSRHAERCISSAPGRGSRQAACMIRRLNDRDDTSRGERRAELCRRDYLTSCARQLTSRRYGIGVGYTCQGEPHVSFPGSPRKTYLSPHARRAPLFSSCKFQDAV